MVHHACWRQLELWIAESEHGELLGILVLDDDWVEQLYVDPTNTGLGSAAFFSMSPSAGNRAGCSCGPLCPTARIALDERHGFVEIKRTDGTDNEERAPDIHDAAHHGELETAPRKCSACRNPGKSRYPFRFERSAMSNAANRRLPHSR